MASDYVFYHYNPSEVAAAIFMALFGILALVHSYQLIRSRVWYFTVFVIGGYFETLGYGARILSAKQNPDWTLAPFLAQTLLTLLAPTLFAASVYMTLGRLITALDAERLAPIRTRWITRIFVTGDVLSFFLQGAGGGFSAGKKANSAEIGKWIIIIGLVVQLIFFGVFVFTAAVFHTRLNKQDARRAIERADLWPKHIYVLYVASALIFVRSAFRVAEYATGADGVIQGHEYYLYIFDAVPMLIVMGIYNFYQPAAIVKSSKVYDGVVDPEQARIPLYNRLGSRDRDRSHSPRKSEQTGSVV